MLPDRPKYWPTSKSRTAGRPSQRASPSDWASSAPHQVQPNFRLQVASSNRQPRVVYRFPWSRRGAEQLRELAKARRCCPGRSKEIRADEKIEESLKIREQSAWTLVVKWNSRSSKRRTWKKLNQKQIDRWVRKCRFVCLRLELFNYQSE